MLSLTCIRTYILLSCFLYLGDQDNSRRTSGISVKIYRLGACLKCHGDLAHDKGDWICLQCGVYYYTGLYDSSRFIGDTRLRIAEITSRQDDWSGPPCAPPETQR